VPTKSDGYKYYKFISSEVLKPMANEVRGIVEVLKTRQHEYIADGLALDLSGRIQSIQRKYDLLFQSPLFINAINAVFNKTANSNRQKFINAINSIVGVNVAEILIDEGLTEFITSQVAKNVSLIKTVSTTALSAIEREVADGVANGARYEVILKNILGRNGVMKGARKRAELIARNETINITSQLNRKRAQNLGIKKFEWVHVGDRRVRGNPAGLYPSAVPSHWALGGKIFEYSKGAPTANGNIFPGLEINCRCQAISIIEED